ncbi:trna-dihydrouridine(47) synthase [NAD(P)+] [Gossypium arboreum]|uniref:Trna-dihydrouridine(47) synthase [NAD(P)+] n=1 Tax=Gossypium arboreum TaxID=29729 RepID=A0A0B0N4K1_GOSAR|nr:trna-dihydrouridine(47) synthase [NAD(P)+] [Gossypium arboreum]
MGHGIGIQRGVTLIWHGPWYRYLSIMILEYPICIPNVSTEKRNDMVEKEVSTR